MHKAFHANGGVFKSELVAAAPPSPPAILLGMPTRGSISVETFGALSTNHDGFRIAPIIVSRQPVDRARNIIAAQMLEARTTCPWNPKPSEFYCLWVDSDAWWPEKTITQAVGILQRRPDIDLLAASFCARAPFAPRVSYRKADDPNSYPQPGRDCEMRDLIPVERCGFHFVAHRIQLLERVGPNPFSTDDTCGEDVAFCRRAREKGAKLVCAPGLLVAHIDPNDGAAYLPGEPAMRVEGNVLKRSGFAHLAPKSAENRSYGLPVEEKM